MPTSLIETRQIEAFLSNTQDPEEHLLFEAKLLLQPDLVDKLNWQKKTHRLLQLYSRQKLKAEILEVERLLFNDAMHDSFLQKIIRLFKR